MIHVNGDVQVITNDSDDNAPGDFSIVRIKVGLVASAQVQAIDGWKLVGFSFTKQTRITSEHVSLVYRFGG